VSKSETKQEMSPLIGARRFLHLLSSNKSDGSKPSEYWGDTLPARRNPKIGKRGDFPIFPQFGLVLRFVCLISENIKIVIALL